MRVMSITIVEGIGADHIMLETDLPPATWPYKLAPTVTFEAARDTAEGYVQKTFPGVPVEIVRRPKERAPSFSRRNR